MARKKSAAAKQRQRAKKAVKRVARRVLKGKGDYVDDQLAMLPSGNSDVRAIRDEIRRLRADVSAGATLRRAGETLGGAFGFGSAGRRLGGAVSSLLGHGDYAIKVNSLMGKYPAESGPAGPTPAFFAKRGKWGTRVVEREYIGDIVTSATTGAFSIGNYSINPGQFKTFPWLSTVAQQFEEYEFLGLVFEFVSTSASYGGGSSQALGAVAMVTDYDALDPTFTSMIQLQNEEGACSTRASENLVHGVECDTSMDSRILRYVRGGAVPAGGTILDFDVGNFQLATQGSPNASANLGQLWVSYDVVLYKKNLIAGPIGYNILSGVMRAKTASTASGTNLLGTAGYALNGNLYMDMGVATSGASGNIFYFYPPGGGGTFLVQYVALGTSATLADPTVTYTNCSVTSPNIPAVVGFLTCPASGTASTRLVWTAIVTASPLAGALNFCSIAFAGATIPTAPTSAYFLVSQIEASQSIWPPVY